MENIPKIFKGKFWAATGDKICFYTDRGGPHIFTVQKGREMRFDRSQVNRVLVNGKEIWKRQK